MGNLGDEVQCNYCKMTYIPGAVLNQFQYDSDPQYKFDNSEFKTYDYIPTQLSKRIGAYIIDLIIIYISTLISNIIVHSETISTFILVFFPLIYFMACDFLMDNSSVGKKILSIKVISINELNPTMIPFDIIKRNLLKFINTLLFPLFIAVLFNEKKQTIYDYLAHTMVVDRE